MTSPILEAEMEVLSMHGFYVQYTNRQNTVSLPPFGLSQASH